MNLPIEIINKISGYYPSPELTATHVCNIPLAVYKFKIEKIKKIQRKIILEQINRVLERYNFN